MGVCRVPKVTADRKVPVTVHSTVGQSTEYSVGCRVGCGMLSTVTGGEYLL